MSNVVIFGSVRIYRNKAHSPAIPQTRLAHRMVLDQIFALYKLLLLLLLLLLLILVGRDV